MTETTKPAETPAAQQRPQAPAPKTEKPKRDAKPAETPAADAERSFWRVNDVFVPASVGDAEAALAVYREWRENSELHVRPPIACRPAHGDMILDRVDGELALRPVRL